MTFDLFPSDDDGPTGPGVVIPLAERLRPRRLDEMVGQERLLAADGFLRRSVQGGRVPSLLLWGPPGSGKTTLARVLAREVPGDFVGLSAVSAGLRDVKDAVARADLNRKRGRPTYLFLDEIHRFNKAQQDALLPHVENGTLVLIGATTENPSFEVNAALLSRLRVITLEALTGPDLDRLVDRALADQERGLGRSGASLAPGARHLLVEAADGDARRLLNVLETAVELVGPGGVITEPELAEALQKRTLRFDRAGEEHYNLISALHKSVRDSDPDGSLYWLARLLEGGEDRLYVARRLVRMATEDIGLADPAALPLALAGRDTAHFLGEPEGDLALAEVAIYLALAPKSNSVYRAWGAALEAAREHGSLPVPLHLRNAVTGLMSALGYGQGYRYAHDEPGRTSAQAHLPDALASRRFYEPTGEGRESALAERLEQLRRLWERGGPGEKNETAGR